MTRPPSRVGREVAASPATATFLALVMPLAFALPCCSSPRSTVPPVAAIYARAVQREARNPVVVIHGILGARLEQRSTGKTVWGAFTSDGIDPNDADGARALALPLGQPASDPDADGDVRATGPLEAIRLSLLFALISVNVYADILRSLGVGGYSDPVLVDPGSPAYSTEHFTCHTFFYDWRLDNVQNARRFGRWLRHLRGDIEERARSRIAALRSESTDDARRRADELDAWLRGGFRFDVVAHSMGGLVARWFLCYGDQDLPADGSLPPLTWAGSELIDRLVMVGTPNLGAMESLQTLTTGFTPGPFLPHYHHALLGTMPSVYQLLPHDGRGLFVDGDGRDIDLDLFDPAVWEQNGWGLLDPAADDRLAQLLPDVADPAVRRARARDHLAWCLRRAHAFHRALDRAPDVPCPTEIRLFAADTIATPVRARLLSKGAAGTAVRIADDDLREPGDGTVARYSAVADRRGRTPDAHWLDSPVPWTSVTFLPDDHLGLTKNPVFTDNLLFFLLEQAPRRR